MTNCFGSFKAKVIRVTRLDACGAPVVGASSVVVSDGFTKVTLTPTYDDGTEFKVPNAWGDFCVNEHDDPRLLRVSAATDFCKVDPSLLDILLDARLLLDGTDGIGFAINEAATTGRFSLEGWTKVPGQACAGGDEQWVYWLVPNLGGGKINGDIVLENAALTLATLGTSKGAPADQWTNVLPFDTNYFPAGEMLVAGDHIAAFVTTIAPPEATCGATAYGTPAETFAVVAFDGDAESIDVAGDQTASFPNGQAFTVVGSALNDGPYTVDASAFAAGVTTITVNEDIVADAAAGLVVLPV